MIRDRRALRALTPLLAALIVLASAAAAQAVTINVTLTNDPTGAGDCTTTDQACSLRQAVAAASAGDTIALGSGTYSLTQGTDIDITQSLTLQGAGVGATTIDGSQNSGTNPYGELARILRVDSPATVTIQNLTFSHGLDERDENCLNGCETADANGGGALFNNGGTIALDDVAFTNDYGSGNPVGGAVSNGSGTLTMTNVSFTGDSAGAGGALYTHSSSTTTGNGVTFQNDSTTCCDGGAAYLLGGNVTLTNTTIVNSGGYDGGGAIANGGATLTLDNVTMSNNGKDLQTDSYATTNVFNTIIGSGCVAPGRGDGLSGGTTGTAIDGQESENIAPDTSCNLSGTGDQSSVNPQLASIADNGGPTLTEALLAGSPALGDPSHSNCPAFDQRGLPRPSGACDIGAFETQLPVITAVSPPTGPTAGGTSVTITGNDLGNASAVNFGSTPASISNDTPTQITAIAPPEPAGTVDVTVTTPGGTSTVGSADEYTYQSPSNPLPSPSLPTVQTGVPSSVTVSAAGLSGAVNPGGLATTAFFEYGLDSKYTKAGTSGPTYTNSTPSQSVGSDSSNHTVGPVAVSGLEPNAEYHVRLVASNSAGTVYGPDITFTTAALPPPGAPSLGNTFNVSVVRGIVLIKVNGVFVPLTQALQIHNGAEIDARNGSLELLTANGQPGKTQHGIFGGAIFRLTQQRTGHDKGLVTLAIVENAFPGAPSYALCNKHKAGEASAAALSSRTLQLLKANAHGKFRTSGKFSAATVRGTIWWVSDRCDGTDTYDITDSVSVVDFVRHKTIILHAGQRYLARKP